MASLLKKSFAQRLATMSRVNTRSLTNCRTSSPRTVVDSASWNRARAAIKRAPDPGEDGIFLRFLHRQSVVPNPAGLGSVPKGETILEKLREMDIARDRIRLSEVRPPAASSPGWEVTVADAKKVLRISQLEKLKSRLRQIQNDCISYPEFMEICVKECSNIDQGLEFAKTLDESGTVIVLGNVVFLKPDQVVKAIQGLLPAPLPSSATNSNDPREEELQELEKQKAAIDVTAETSVKRELWCGLAYLVVQTAAFMRLTFWELTWDVMEPVCFFVTSVYFMGAFVFFLITSKEPSFEGFLQCRFSAKQRRLFRAKRFDFERYKELRGIMIKGSN